MEVNETRNSRILWKSMRPETVWLLIFFEISENWLNGFENGKKTEFFKKKKEVE